MHSKVKVSNATLFNHSVEILKQSTDSTSRNNSTNSQVTYEPLQVVGRGSFGLVIKAKVRGTGKIVAVKKVLFDGRLHHRELALLRDHLGPIQTKGDSTNIEHYNNFENNKYNTNINYINKNNSNIEVINIKENIKILPTIIQYHPNIICLLDHFSVCGPNGEQYLYIVMDYLPLDIHHLQYIYIKQKQQRMPLIFIKIIMFQLARALTFLHLRDICHRDVKPGNILINPETGIVKLCDFGSAKIMQSLNINGPREKNVSYICSRYYRAPELLLGSLYYHFYVDMWAFGCVLAELLCGNILFKGNSTVDQMAEIFKILGSPSRQELLALNPQSAEALLYTNGIYLGQSTGPNLTTNTPTNPTNPTNPTTTATTASSTINNNNNNDYLQRYQALRIKSLQWKSVLPPNTPPSAISLVGELLRYTPTDRLSAAEVLEHSFFDDIFSEDASLPNGAPLPVNMFQLTTEESEILPHWLLERMAAAENNAKERHAIYSEKGV